MAVRGFGAVVASHSPLSTPVLLPQSKLALVEALIEERGARLLAQQAAGDESAQLALMADERRTLGLLLDTVREMQAGGGGAAAPA